MPKPVTVLHVFKIPTRIQGNRRSDLKLSGRFESVGRLIKLIKRPTREEFVISTKITILGIGILGVIGFIIKFMSAILLVARPVTA
jgi:protein translocase SEC61 complex gamma subunit